MLFSIKEIYIFKNKYKLAIRQIKFPLNAKNPIFVIRQIYYTRQTLFP